MNSILYSAEQLLSHGHAELIHHLYNAQLLLNEYLRESQHNEHSSSSTQNVNYIYFIYIPLTLINFYTVEEGGHFSSSEASDSSDSHEDSASKLLHVCELVCGGGGVCVCGCV